MNTEAMASAADLDWLSRAPQLRGRHDIVIAAAAMIRQQAGEIERLTKCLASANSQAEHYEREWYLRGDEIERLTTETGRLKSMLAESPAALDVDQWLPIDSCPELTDVLLVCGEGKIGRGKKLTRDDGIMWEFERRTSHERIWQERLPYGWRPLPAPPAQQD